MEPVNFQITPSFLVPQVTGSFTKVETWDLRKLYHLVHSLQGNSYSRANFDKMRALSSELLVHLFQKLNTFQGKAKAPLLRAIYFDVTKFLSSPQFQENFEKGCKKALGFVPVSIRIKDTLFYSFWTHGKSKPNQRENTKVLPDAIWGRVFSFMDIDDTAKGLTLASSFTSDAYLIEAFQGKEDEIATKWARKLCEQYNPEENAHIKLPSLLEVVKGRVRKINLSGLTLTPHLLKSLALLLPSIEELNLSYAQGISECIQVLQDFPHLKVLCLQDSYRNHSDFVHLEKIKDYDLQHLQNCKSLEELDVDSTEVTGEFFQYLPSTIRELNCSETAVTDVSLSHLKDKNKLRKLVLREIYITGQYFSALPSSLEELVCTAEELSDEALLGLRDKTQLKRLELGFSKSITGEYFDALPISLEDLTFKLCKTLQDTPGLQNKTKLTIINFWDTGIQDENLATLPLSIQELNCDECNLTDEAIKELQKYPQLEILDISRNKDIKTLSFSSEGTRHVLPQSLKQLYCRDCSLNDSAINALQHSNLETLDISKNVAITGKSFNSLPTSLKRLICQNEGNNSNLTDEAIANLQHLSQLETLDISGNHLLTGKNFHLLPPSLKVLICTNKRVNSQLSDLAVEKLQNLPNLTELDFSHTSNLTTKNLHLLPASLREFTFKFSNFTDEVFEKLNLSRLHTLDLSYSKLITGEKLDFLPNSIRELFFNCTRLNVEALQKLQNKTSLEELNIEICDMIMDAHVARSLPSSLKKIFGARFTPEAESILKERRIKCSRRMFLIEQA